MVLTLIDVLHDLDRVCVELEREIWGVRVESRRRHALGHVGADLSFQPLPELVDDGYEQERARITVLVDGTILTLPIGERRMWKHRETSPLGADFGQLGGPLCLFYPKDPRALRWEWPDGFEAYVSRVHRHLFYEEYWRRQERWPVEDAPHGPSPVPHPVISERMRREIGRWAAA